MGWSLALIAGLLMFGTAMAAPTPAGTIISNQAQAVIDGQEVVPSNRVDTVVLEVCRGQFSPAGNTTTPGQRAAIVPPSAAYLSYVLSNQGNVSATFALGHETAAGGDWLPDALNFYDDNNANGLVDANEELITDVRLAPGAHVRLVMAVVPPAGAVGELLVGPLAACGGLTSNPAFAAVEARQAKASALRLQHSVTDEGVQPDGSRRFEILTTVANYGGGDATAAWLELDLSAALAAGLTLDPASLIADKGTLTVAAAGSWQSLPVASGAAVSGVRLELPGLTPDEAAALTLALVLKAPGESVTVSLPVSAGSDLGPNVHSVGHIVLEAAYDHGLIRRGGENLQLIAGQPKCMPFALENLGTAADTYSFTTTVTPVTSDVLLSLRTTSGLPLAAKIPLAAAESLALELCVVAEAPRRAPLTVALNAISEANSTSKTATVTVSTVVAADGLILEHSADPLGTLSAGSEIDYWLTIRNGYEFALTNVRVRNDLDDDLQFLAGTEDYTAANHVARWQVDTLQPGESAELRLTGRVDPDASDDTVVSNRFALTAGEISDPVLSSTIVHTAWSSSLLLETAVTPDRGVTYGDVLSYSLKVTNPSTAALTLTLEERMPEGVGFLDSDTPAGNSPAAAGKTAGSTAGSTVLGGTQAGTHGASAVFSHSGTLLTWSGLTLGAGDTIVVRYRARIMPEASKALVNGTVARGESVNGAAVASAVASTNVQVSAGVFERDRGVLLGRVFLDRDGEPGYLAGVDEPLKGVRLIVGGGLQTLSDAAGLYAFRDVEVGVTSLLVDPASLPFELRRSPNSLGEYRYAVAIQGVSVQDIEALAPLGQVGAVVELELVIGPLSVSREVVPGETGDLVRLRLVTSEPLHELTITDSYADGQPWSHTFESFDGTAELSFEAGGRAADALPSVRWRYP